LIKGLKGDIADQDFSTLKVKIADMRTDGSEVSVTSVRREYSSNGDLKSVMVGITNETPRYKVYTVYAPKA
jgi:hypothetical protein